MNEETAFLMASDRCGVPDILDTKTDMHRQKRFTFVGKVKDGVIQ